MEAAAELLENLRGGFGFDSHLKSALVVVRVLAVVRVSIKIGGEKERQGDRGWCWDDSLNLGTVNRDSSLGINSFT